DAEPMAAGDGRLRHCAALYRIEGGRTTRIADAVAEQPALAPSPTFGLAPGIVGGVAEHIFASANQPSEAFAVATGLGVTATLIGRRLAGPTRNAVHLYQAIIGPSGSGKENIRATSKRQLTTVGAAGHIGPGRWKSGAGLIRGLMKCPAQLSIQDELGGMFA